MGTAICDSRIPKKALENLKKYCGRIILLPPFDALAKPVSAHPDMLLFPIKETRTILTHKRYAEILTPLLIESEYSVLQIPEDAESVYPRDILLNAARVGSKLFCKASHTSTLLLSTMEELKVEPINVNQGYAKCSTLIIDEGAIVTSDSSIADGAEAQGIEVLRVSKEGVALDGYNCGFIGGASGSDSKRIFFCGNIYSHPDGQKRTDFCRKHGKEPISLSEEALYDVGSIFMI